MLGKVFIHVLRIIDQCYWGWCHANISHTHCTCSQARPLQPSNNYLFDVVTTTGLDRIVNSHPFLIINLFWRNPGLNYLIIWVVLQSTAVFLFPIDQLAYVPVLHACTNWSWTVQHCVINSCLFQMYTCTSDQLRWLLYTYCIQATYMHASGYVPPLRRPRASFYPSVWLYPR